MNVNCMRWSDGLPADDWAVEDARRIQRVIKKHGEKRTLEEIFRIWEDFSLEHHAGWRILPKSDEDLWALWCVWDPEKKQRREPQEKGQDHAED